MAKQQQNWKRDQKKIGDDIQKWRVSIYKNDMYNIEEMKLWIGHFAKGKTYYRHYKKNSVFYFYNVEDAFKFKMRWEIT